MLEALPENPDARGVARDDVLSALLSSIRLSGSLQFCFMPTGDWQTDAAPTLAALSAKAAGTMPFHIVVAGSCWLKAEGEETALEAGDVLVFPFATGHQLGAGKDGMLVLPTRDLPQKPWREIPVLRYGEAAHGVRLLCGYLQWDGLSFGPLRQALPKLIHVRTRTANDGDWLRATICQMVEEVDRPRAGGVSMLPRLTEIIFIEILRHQISRAAPQATGWLAALADPALSRCLSLIHGDPGRDWSLELLAAAANLSRSAFADRFQAVLATSPIRYVRDWRLTLASMALATTARPIASIAYDAGYATEAAFNRAFSRAFATPPAAWRAMARG
ncbi:AraC family transcriptional regulator [Rhizobium lentis]|uniref:AraC family transcriptional regulator n=1 Tax=Rhizobium lentis TaxID=1138194 RepID=A0A9Q3M687_9HYPH|nr:AraC family transcriptional regulator [Rhizobium lentis]MBX4957312.1 AraC family transcriptional regulator [Rhizobium lentis]MBX4975112.1 AraC family transcriptional regulator [Rhizobium lentis]MBX4987302.1 AraC family transcriptional regulator [Rhizobium lentis]MBX4997273.1 AraC family transcriptional regulator [Rhizobium lentis]MBX5005746.1 AraC family transcriptional regulator [Rhizobium lentis]